MSEFTLELVRADGNESLVSRYTTTAEKAESFKSESIKAAEAILKNHKNKGVLLFLENSFESLAMLEAFIETGVPFETVTLSCGRLTTPVVTKWKPRLEALGIKLHEVRFDYENPKHLSELAEFQQEFQVVSVMNLLKMWTACRFDGYMVFSGDICLPQLDQMNKVASWGLPDLRQLALYNFSKSFYVEPFFLTSTHGLFKAQTENDFAAAIIQLHRAEERGFLLGNFAVKKIWFNWCHFQKTRDWPVTDEVEPPWQAGLRFEERDAFENFFVIVDRIREVRHSGIKEVSEIYVTEPVPGDIHSLEYKELMASLVKQSSDLNTVGAAAPVSLKNATGSDRAYAMFPYLMLQSDYPDDIAPIRDNLSRLTFFNNSSNYISATDLHLRSEFSGLVKFFEEKARLFFEVQGKMVREIEITQCWANRAKAGESHHQHSHPNSIVSGIFYLNDGGGGDTIFSKEVPENMVVYLPQKSPTPFNSLSVRVRPKAGQLVLFPSFINHEVMPHADRQESRYTIAFNVFVRDSIGSFSAGSWLDLRKL